MSSPLFLSEAEFFSLYKNPKNASYSSPQAMRQALTIIIHTDNLALFRVMCERGLDINSTLKRGQTLLTESIYQKSPEIFDYLVKHKANPNLSKHNKYLPLCAAFDKRNYNAIPILLGLGANPNIEIEENFYLVEKLVDLEQFQNIFTLFIQHGLDENVIHKPNRHGQSLFSSVLNYYRRPPPGTLEAMIDSVRTPDNIKLLQIEIEVSQEKYKGLSNQQVYQNALEYLTIKYEQLLLEQKINKTTPQLTGLKFKI